VNQPPTHNRTFLYKKKNFGGCSRVDVGRSRRLALGDFSLSRIFLQFTYPDINNMFLLKNKF
jgi:hypothetical protein